MPSTIRQAYVQAKKSSLVCTAPVNTTRISSGNHWSLPLPSFTRIKVEEETVMELHDRLVVVVPPASEAGPETSLRWPAPPRHMVASRSIVVAFCILPYHVSPYDLLPLLLSFRLAFGRRSGGGGRTVASASSPREAASSLRRDHRA